MPYFLDLKIDNGDVYSIPSISHGYAEGTVKTPTSAHKANQILFGDNTWAGGASEEYIILSAGSSTVNVG